jgi:hypothetical protein
MGRQLQYQQRNPGSAIHKQMKGQVQQGGKKTQDDLHVCWHGNPAAGSGWCAAHGLRSVLAHGMLMHCGCG